MLKYKGSEFVVSRLFTPQSTLLLILTYCICRGWSLLLGNAVYWDDWAYHGAPRDWILTDFRETGNIFNISGWSYWALSTFDPWVSKSALFITELITALLVLRVTRDHFDFPHSQAVCAAILFAVLPMNAARIAYVNFNSALCVMIFFVAWVLIERHKFLSTLLFFLSFQIQSLLMFFAFPYATYFLRRHKEGTIYDNRFYLLSLALLPFSWFYIKTAFFVPFGNYTGYNQNWSLEDIPLIVHEQYLDTKRFVVEDILEMACENKPLLISVLFFALLYFVTERDLFFKGRWQCSWRTFALGTVLFIFACFPYWVVGHTPTFWEWTSRHQLLMPLGSALIIISLIMCLPQVWGRAAFGLFVGFSIFINMMIYNDFAADWSKQKKIISELSMSAAAADCDLFIFFDRTENAIKRGYRFYEWTGLLHEAFPNNFSRFGLSHYDYPALQQGKYERHFTRFYASHRFQPKLKSAECSVHIDSVDRGIHVVVALEKD